MGKYLEIAQKALAQAPSKSTEDRCITKDQQLKGDSHSPLLSTQCEISEISEISPEDDAGPALEPLPRIDWGESPLVQSVDKRSRKLQESPDELREAAEDDWDEVSNDPAQLVAFADSLAIVLIRESRGVPDHYNFVTHCQKCGPVPVYEGLPRAIEQCPWCLCGQTPPPILGVSE